MRQSQIEWTNHTFNPWLGCVKVSPACANCYAEKIARRFAKKWADKVEVELSTPTVWGKNSDRLIYPFYHHKWSEPIRWNASAERRGVIERVFCGSMCDIMERNPLVDEARKKVFTLIEQTPNLEWLLLTKRPHEFKSFLPKAWINNPLPNVWLMTTVEHPAYLWRIDELLNVPAVVHGLSLEPLLGDITLPDSFLKLGDRGWVITGGESGSKARPANADLIRQLRDACTASHVPFFFKQWGRYNENLVKLKSKKENPVLDGQSWLEVPASLREDAFERWKATLVAKAA